MSEDTKTLPPWGETKIVGKPLPRIDAHERVSGSATYTMDLQRPGMLHVAVLRCPHAHAMIKSIDTSRAESMPGVRAVMTARTPGANMPWHFGQQGPASMLFDMHCRHEGEEVAAVAAETLFQASEAARAIVVEYETLSAVCEIEEAAKLDDATAKTAGVNRVGPWVYERGNIADGFKQADVVVERTFQTSVELHCCMEYHNSVAEWDGDRLTVWDSSQSVFDAQQYLSQAMQIPLSSVRVICRYMGGGFGSKLGIWKYEVIAALLAKRTGRPVHISVPREDAFRVVGNRPAHILTLKAGVRKDGTLTALQLVGTGGHGAYPETAFAGWQVRDLYLCPNVKTEETSISTNTGKSAAMRAPGQPQGSWALEQVMDELAEKIGIDPIELRLKNIPDKLQTENLPFTTTGLKDCIAEGAKRFGWKEARARSRQNGHVVRGVGMAAAFWFYPGETVSTAIVKLFADGSANLNLGASDIGTGTKTVMAMVVAEELGIPIEKIQVEHADTGTTQYAPGSGGSQTVLANSPAVRSAAADVRKQLLELASEQMKAPVNELALKDGKIVRTGSSDTIAIPDLKRLGQQHVIVGIGRREPHPAGSITLPFAAQFAEVEVNELTGEIKVLRLLGAHDSGRVMNRLTYENQVFGGMTMGMGFALTERRILDGPSGKMVNANFHDYKIPTAKDVPLDMICLPIDPHDTSNNTGTKGLGEPATIPTAAAIANAVYNATGVRVTQSPITSMQMLKLLAERKGRA